MRIIVQKFGGTSVANPERIQSCANRIVSAITKGYHVVAVVSALGGTTDDLVDLANQMTDTPPRREMDVLLSTGEQISMALMAMAVQKLGKDSISLSGRQAGIHTDGVHTKARITHVDPKRVHLELEAGKVVIVAGFQGVNEHSDVTTLGRGGSDTTAVALAAALNAEMCEIYTDVDGVYTADPRAVKSARKLLDISYGEMLEMASLGAGVLQPRAVEFGAQRGVPIHVRSSYDPSEGTLVREVRTLESDLAVVGTAHDANVAKVSMKGVPDRPGIAYKIFAALAKEGIDVDMIVQTTRAGKQCDLVFSTARDDLQRTKRLVDELATEMGASPPQYNDHVAKVSIIGAGMMSRPGIAAKMFEALSDNKINIQVISTSEIKVSCLVASDEMKQAVNAVHDAFQLGRSQLRESKPISIAQ